MSNNGGLPPKQRGQQRQIYSTLAPRKPSQHSTEKTGTKKQKGSGKSQKSQASLLGKENLMQWKKFTQTLSSKPNFEEFIANDTETANNSSGSLASDSAQKQQPSSMSLLRTLYSSKEEARRSLESMALEMEKKLGDQFVKVEDVQDYFEGVEDFAGVEVWRIVGLTPVPLPPLMYGSFREGDCYIILSVVDVRDKTGTEIHYWLGKHASNLKAAVCAFLVFELQKKLNRGAIKHHRHEQGNESEKFRAFFPGGHITYLSGGDFSTVILKNFFSSSKSKEFSRIVSAKYDIPRLIQIRLRNPTSPDPASGEQSTTAASNSKTMITETFVNPVEFSRKSLQSNDVFVLESLSTIFVWKGNRSGPFQHWKANALAKRMQKQTPSFIRKFLHKSSSRVPVERDIVEMEEGAEPEPFLKQFVALPRKFTGEDGAEEEEEEEEEILDDIDPILYKINVIDGKKMQVQEFSPTTKIEGKEDKPQLLSKNVRSAGSKLFEYDRHLHGESAMILESRNEVHAWFGGKSKFLDRKFAMALANRIKEVNTQASVCSRVTVQYEGSETDVFLEKFKPQIASLLKADPRPGIRAKSIRFDEQHPILQSLLLLSNENDKQRGNDENQDAASRLRSIQQLFVDLSCMLFPELQTDAQSQQQQQQLQNSSAARLLLIKKKQQKYLTLSASQPKTSSNKNLGVFYIWRIVDARHLHYIGDFSELLPSSSPDAESDSSKVRNHLIGQLWNHESYIILAYNYVNAARTHQGGNKNAVAKMRRVLYFWDGSHFYSEFDLSMKMTLESSNNAKSKGNANASSQSSTGFYSPRVATMVWRAKLLTLFKRSKNLPEFRMEREFHESADFLELFASHGIMLIHHNGNMPTASPAILPPKRQDQEKTAKSSGDEDEEDEDEEAETDEDGETEEGEEEDQEAPQIVWKMYRIYAPIKDDSDDSASTEAPTSAELQPAPMLLRIRMVELKHCLIENLNSSDVFVFVPFEKSGQSDHVGELTFNPEKQSCRVWIGKKSSTLVRRFWKHWYQEKLEFYVHNCFAHSPPASGSRQQENETSSSEKQKQGGSVPKLEFDIVDEDFESPSFFSEVFSGFTFSSSMMPSTSIDRSIRLSYVRDKIFYDRIHVWRISLDFDSKIASKMGSSLSASTSATAGQNKLSHNGLIVPQYGFSRTGNEAADALLLTQQDLDESAIYVIDSYWTVYIWKGTQVVNDLKFGHADEQATTVPSCRLERSDRAAIMLKLAQLFGKYVYEREIEAGNRPKTSSKLLEIESGLEPIQFKSLFLEWTNRHGDSSHDDFTMTPLFSEAEIRDIDEIVKHRLRIQFEKEIELERASNGLIKILQKYANRNFSPTAASTLGCFSKYRSINIENAKLLFLLSQKSDSKFRLASNLAKIPVVEPARFQSLVLTNGSPLASPASKQSQLSNWKFTPDFISDLWEEREMEGRFVSAFEDTEQRNKKGTSALRPSITPGNYWDVLSFNDIKRRFLRGILSGRTQNDSSQRSSDQFDKLVADTRKEYRMKTVRAVEWIPLLQSSTDIDGFASGSATNTAVVNASAGLGMLIGSSGTSDASDMANTLLAHRKIYMHGAALQLASQLADDPTNTPNDTAVSSSSLSPVMWIFGGEDTHSLLRNDLISIEFEPFIGGTSVVSGASAEPARIISANVAFDPSLSASNPSSSSKPSGKSATGSTSMWPPIRCGHSMISLAFTDSNTIAPIQSTPTSGRVEDSTPLMEKLIVFGGSHNGDDLWEFSYETRQWRNIMTMASSSAAAVALAAATAAGASSVPAERVRPTPRRSFSMIADPSRNRLVVFGGKSPGYIQNDYVLADLWQFSFGAKSWSRVVPKSAADPWPMERCGHSAVFCSLEAASGSGAVRPSAKMLLFGGQDPDGHYLNDLWSFDLDTNTWTAIDPIPGGDLPTARERHSAVYCNGRMFIFGGWTKGGPLGDLWEYDIPKNRWRQLDCLSKEKPCQRYGHSAVFHRGRMLIFGGKDHMFRNLSEVWECAFLEEDRVWDAKELAVEKKKVKKSHKNVMRELLRQFTEQGDADAVEPELEAEEEGNEEESAPQQQSQPTQEPVATSQAPKVEDPLERMLREVMSKIEVPVVVARRPPSTESSQSALSQPTLSTPSSLTTPATEEIVPPSELQTEKGPEAATEVSKQEEQAVVAIEPKITLPEPESEPKITLPEPQPQPQSEPEPEGPNADPAEEEELLLLLLAQEQASAADSRLEDDLMGSEDKQISGGKYTKDEYIDLYQDSPITTNAPSIGEDSSPLPSQTRSGRSSKSVSFFSDS